MVEKNVDLQSIGSMVPLAKQGNRDAQNVILQQVQDYILHIARCELSDDVRRRLNPSDIVQLTMTRMINGFENFRGTTEPEFYSWLRAIMKNEIRSSRRQMHQDKRDIKREREFHTPSGNWNLPETNDPRHTPCSHALNEEKVAQLQVAMQRLNPAQAEVINLRNFEELGFQEIANRMNRTYDSAAKLWQRAIVCLQQELDQLNSN